MTAVYVSLDVLQEESKKVCAHYDSWKEQASLEVASTSSGVEKQGTSADDKDLMVIFNSTELTDRDAIAEGPGY